MALLHTVTRGLLSVLAACLAIAAMPASGQAQQTVVTAVVAPSLGVAIAADGRAEAAGTVDFAVTRRQYGRYRLVTVTPR